MLRNFAFSLLREVHTVLLNEVLSLNAQDLPIEVFNPAISCFLNEVLSLNAQGFRLTGVDTEVQPPSSMKS